MTCSARTCLPSSASSSDPGLARLGGEEREVSVLFADLAGFTAFSEKRPPAEIIQMLNTYWAAVVPVIERAGGVVDYFAGDGVLAVFNAAGDQPDHAERAVKAGLAIVDSARSDGESGLANVSCWREHRPSRRWQRRHRRSPSFTVIGDTTNVAARLLAVAEPGSVVVSAASWASLGERIDGVALGPLALKGKRDPVEAWSVTGAAASA